MSDVTPGRRRLGRVLLAGGALALPLTASISYAAAPDAEAAEAPTAVHRTQHRMVVIDKPSGATLDDTTLFTHLVRRPDGATVELRTDRRLSDQEARDRVAEAFASMPEAPEPPEPPAPPAAPAAPRVMALAPMAPVPPMPPMPPIAFDHRGMPADADFERKMEAWGDEMEKWGEEYGERFAAQARAQAEAHVRTAEQAARFAPEVIESCDAREQRRTTTADGRTRIVICQRDIEERAQARAMAGLQSARRAIASNRALGEEIRREILEDLDGEIERLERDEG